MKYRFANFSDTIPITEFIKKVDSDFLPTRKKTKPSLSKLIENKKYKLILALDGKNIDGYISYLILTKNIAKIRSIAVSKEKRGKGIGLKLAKTALKKIKSEKVTSVITRTWETNDASRSLFEKLGFRKYYTIPNNRVNGESTIWLRKRI